MGNETDRTLPFDFDAGGGDQKKSPQEKQTASQRAQQSGGQPSPGGAQQPGTGDMKAFEDFFASADAAPLTPQSPAPMQPPSLPPQPPDDLQQTPAPSPSRPGGDTAVGKRGRRRATKRFAVDMFLPMLMGGLLTVIFIYVVIPAIPGSLGLAFAEKITQRGSIPYFSTIFLFWHLSHVLFRYAIRIKPEFRIITMGLLPAGTSEITNQDLLMIGHNASVVDGRYDGGTLLTRRLLLAVAHLQIRRDIAELGDLLRRRAEADRSRAANAYSIPNFIFWAIPILGFVGTVVGIGAAVGGLQSGFSGVLDSSQLGESLKVVTSELSVAFDTTLVALLMSMIAYLTQTLVRQQESQLLSDVEDYLTYRLQSRIKTETSEDRMEGIMREALREMTTLQQSLTIENQKNSKLTMQTMMGAQQSFKHAIDNFPQMLVKATETSSQILQTATTNGQTIMDGIKQRLAEIVQALSSQLREAFAEVGSALDASIAKQNATAESIVRSVDDAGKNLAVQSVAAFGQLSEDFTKMGADLQTAARATVTSMSETIVGVGEEAKLKVQAIGEEFLAKISAESQGLYANAADQFQKTIKPMQEFLEKVVAALEQALVEGHKLVAVEDALAKNIGELSRVKKLDEALDGLRYTLVSLQPMLETLRKPAPLRINLGGVELPVSGTRGF
jgi:biopolymer transport protein ExbB/TolQ